MSLFRHVNAKWLLPWAFFFLSLADHVEPRSSSSERQAFDRKRLVSNLKRSAAGRPARRDMTDAPAACAEAPAAVITAPKANIWGQMTDAEVSSVAAWLFAQKELNLTVTKNATDWDNMVRNIETMPPNKTDALVYLDKNGKAPPKYARVVLDNRATENLFFADILVGPLPVDNATTKWEPLTYSHTKKDGGRVRNIDEPNYGVLLHQWYHPIGASVADITEDLWNGSCRGLKNDTIGIGGTTPLWQEADGSVMGWSTFVSLPVDDFDTSTLQPLGLSFLSNFTGRYPSKWSILGWVYNDVFYNTTEEFRAAHRAGKVVKNGANVEGDWARTDRQGPVLPMDEVHPPVQGAPGGARFSVDREQNYVEWMGYSFYIGFSRDLGITLWDIRYKGERLLYELGLQEALAHYADIDPLQSSTAYLDTNFGFGPLTFGLVRGYDCPAHATYLNTSFYSPYGETTGPLINSICLFEFDADYPMQRHSAYNYKSVTKNTHFTVRTVSTIGNYDYMFSYSFYMDGSMTVEVRASGYIQASYFANDADYGFKIHDFLSGSMHDHVLNFKADFDIAGTGNSVQLMKVVPVTKEYSWSRGQKRNTMALERRFLETEDEGSFNWDANGATQVLVVNEKAPNAYGEYRGYRILPSSGTAHLTVLNSTNLQQAARWAEHDLYVTRRKDTEPWSSHRFNAEDVLDPPVNFARFLDGEGLRDEDLVVWLNLGMHHVPHTGDLPNTVFTTARSSVQFMPSNYFMADQSRQTVNMMRINYGGDGRVSDVETFGQANDTCAAHLTPEVGHKGDAELRNMVFEVGGL